MTFTDVDGDGLKDLLVADLGQFLPGDHTDGAVIWMRGLGNGKFGGFWADGWPRVADVEAGDFNGDGKIDLAVAAFGWRTTGHIAILENQTTQREPAVVRAAHHRSAPGRIHIVPIDLNKDGKLDFVALISQQYETVVAYINSGKGDFSFVPRVLYEAPHPNWGSTGIQVVDLDKDGDPDVLLTHGDTLDDALVKPYHGIQWLENTGGEGTLRRPTTWRRCPPSIARWPPTWTVTATSTSSRARCCRGASTSTTARCRRSCGSSRPSRGVFVRHTIEMGFPRHATLDVADIDGDGDIDIVTGAFSPDKPAKSWVQVGDG